MALGGNRNTAYCHALFTYNQIVKSKVTDVAIKTEKHFRIRIIKVGVNHFLLYHFACIGNCAEIMNFIMRTHPLHFTSSSTSFHEFIYFIELTHTAAVAEGDD